MCNQNKTVKSLRNKINRKQNENKMTRKTLGNIKNRENNENELKKNKITNPETTHPKNTQNILLTSWLDKSQALKQQKRKYLKTPIGLKWINVIFCHIKHTRNVIINRNKDNK